jgi:hypothetical protein
MLSGGLQFVRLLTVIAGMLTQEIFDLLTVCEPIDPPQAGFLIVCERANHLSSSSLAGRTHCGSFECVIPPSSSIFAD